MLEVLRDGFEDMVDVVALFYVIGRSTGADAEIREKRGQVLRMSRIPLGDGVERYAYFFSQGHR